ncbi:MAG TPA: S8 family serine peptidase [Phycisphaerales bacterium]|nr:S8 family serine peptidase [Phycisphaerales bacterium]
MSELPPHEARSRDSQARTLARTFTHEYVAHVDEYFITIPPGYTEDSLGAMLLESGLYEWVRPDWILYPVQAHQVIPDDPWFESQWHLGRISAPAAWDISAGSPEVIVAVIDTGVDFTHPDLASNMVLGYCSYCAPPRPQTINPPWNTITLDANGHGTGVAGVLGAVGNNNLGISGVAWNLRLMPIRATNTSGTGGSFGSIQNGAMWASANGAKVISVSFSGVEEPLVDTLGATMRSRNVVLVWSMDNRGVDTAATFDHPNITVVSGTGVNDERWCSVVNPTLCSSIGGGVDIAAPAHGIRMTTIGGEYGVNEGVSFAAPQVAAAMGLIRSVAPSLLAGEVEQVLLAAADDVGPPGEDSFSGRGRLNVRRAMWNAIIRQHASSMQLGDFNPQAFSMDEVYEFLLRPMDVTGDALIDEKDPQAVQGFMRRNEFKDLVADRP